MPLARKHQISLVDTPYYHCVSRCVRRAFLCGSDPLSGRNYEHRRQWVEDRLLFLAQVFCIDVCAFAVMSNHTHVVLHVDQCQAQSLSDEEILRRWCQLHKPPLLLKQAVEVNCDSLSDSQTQTRVDTLSVYRQRLCSISWFMRELNEPIARQANREDDCTGHFWEGRFKSQALLDEQALIACMAYVDLNPVRANLAKHPEEAPYTSIRLRLQALKKGTELRSLLPFTGQVTPSDRPCLPLYLADYINLLDTSLNKALSRLDTDSQFNQSAVLTALELDESSWLTLSHHFEAVYGVAAGHYQVLQQFKHHTHRKRIRGKRLIPLPETA